MKTPIPQLLVLLPIVWFGSLQNTQAVNPPPDGGYPRANTAEGADALFSLTTAGGSNTAIGFQALYSDKSGDNNTATGAAALNSNVTGSNNTATGFHSLFTNTSGRSNTATGFRALNDNTLGQANTATGDGALLHNNSGGRNTALGYAALSNNTTGIDNIAVGFSAGVGLTTGSHNIAIGDAGEAGESGTIRIGDSDNTRTFIAGIRRVVVSGSPVVVGVGGQLGVVASSQQFKDDIKPIEKASEAILGLKPVSFHYKKNIDPDLTAQFGLVAEDVEKINPDLVVHDETGKPYSVRYDAVNAMLLNEFLKEHRKVQEQEATIVRLNKTIDTVLARLDKQDSKIQGVSDQVKMTQTQ